MLLRNTIYANEKQVALLRDTAEAFPVRDIMILV